jgi:hypothetical protein
MLEERRPPKSAKTIGITNGERKGFGSVRGICLAGIAKAGDDLG